MGSSPWPMASAMARTGRPRRAGTWLLLGGGAARRLRRTSRRRPPDPMAGLDASDLAPAALAVACPGRRGTGRCRMAAICARARTPRATRMRPALDHQEAAHVSREPTRRHRPAAPRPADGAAHNARPIPSCSRTSGRSRVVRSADQVFRPVRPRSARRRCAPRRRPPLPRP